MFRKHILYLSLLLSVLFFVCTCQKDTNQVSDKEFVAYAKKIHDRVLTLDTHVDIEVSFITPEFYKGRKHEKLVTVPKMEEGEIDAVFFAAYVGQGPLNKKGYKHAFNLVSEKISEINKVIRDVVYEKYEIAFSPEDVKRIHHEGKKAAVIALENGYAIGEDIENIRILYDLGVRYITLCHNGNNQICDSHVNIGKPKVYHKGISLFGKRVIAEMNRLGIMVDISHLSKKSMLDAVRLSKAPVIASHSSCQALCDVSRNLDDMQLLTLKENNGVINIVGLDTFVKEDPLEKKEAVRELRGEFKFPLESSAFYPVFQNANEEKRLAYEIRLNDINKKFPRANVKDFVDHIDHVVQLIGINHVGIGSDFFLSEKCLADWKDASESFNITMELLRRDYSEEDIGKIWGGNLLRVWKEVNKIAEDFQARQR